MINFIKNLPKAELHLHIEGSLEPELMFLMAKRNNIRLPYSQIEEIKELYNFTDLQSFLNIYYSATSVLIKKKDFFDLTYSYLQRAFEEGIKHVEIFFDPQSHTSRGIPFAIVIEGIYEALEKGQKDFNISFFLIMSFLRHLPEEDAFKCLNEAMPYRTLIKAVGLDSSELEHPPRKFEHVFKKAQEIGFLTVAHAGEEGPPEYIWEALNLLNVSRIDHGVRALEDRVLINEIIKRKIPLTVCPLSNVKLKVYNSLKEHNIKELYNLGVCVTINSDDPSYFGGYILENYSQCQSAFDFSINDICQFAINSFKASFLDQFEKEKHILDIENINKLKI